MIYPARKTAAVLQTMQSAVADQKQEPLTVDDVTAMVVGQIGQILPMDEEAAEQFQQLAKKMIEQAGKRKIGNEENQIMCDEFVNLTAENLNNEHLCCIIRTVKPHPGVEAKRRWLSERLQEGHTFRKLNVKGTVFIEYAPLETAWVPITGENYYYIYCLWVSGDYRGKGYAKSLMEYCVADAKAKGKSGVCMLGARKQKAWLSDQSFAKKFGFKVVDTTDNGYELLALSFDGTTPVFEQNAKSCEIASKELTVYYDMQCPFIYQNIEILKEYCASHDVPASFIQIDTLQKAKELPCVFNNWALFYKGKFETVNLLDVAHLKKILNK